MIPVAVGGFHHHIIRFGQVFRVPDNGLVQVADVSGKDNDLSGVSFGDGDLNAGAAQKVSGVHKPGGNALEQRDGLMVLYRAEQGDGGVCILHGIQWGSRIPPGPLAFALPPLGFRLLNMGAVSEHNFHKLTGLAGGDDLLAVSFLHQQGKPSGVVDVRMGD